MNLTPMQLQVAKLISEAEINKRIAFLLGHSEGAVDQHITAIGKRWGVDHTKNVRVQIARKYWELYR